MNTNTAELLDHLTSQTRNLLETIEIDQPLIVGIHTGGLWVAQHIHDSLRLTTEMGELDISFYRDDFSRLGLNPQVKPSKLPLDITDQHIILVDDVLHTGRTIRAALNELFDYGRPASVHLAVLIDRGGRELPIFAQVAGQIVDLPPNQHVKLTGPDPLTLELITT
ncbi:MAG: bifunctional pyr operon transcriptional regulator/uracil phosphoribosyltransferase PyrR [Pseudomonadota bacterium]